MAKLSKAEIKDQARSIMATGIQNAITLHVEEYGEDETYWTMRKEYDRVLTLWGWE